MGRVCGSERLQGSFYNVNTSSEAVVKLLSVVSPFLEFGCRAGDCNS
ncbi:hypothetical protein M758_UG060900 [Ceratodon purpureus]|nr:hypothetical protein M758_UG060900 [Ceratodon purpureus]